MESDPCRNDLLFLLFLYLLLFLLLFLLSRTESRFRLPTVRAEIPFWPLGLLFIESLIALLCRVFQTGCPELMGLF